MNNLNLSHLPDVKIVGQFGTHDVALIWLIASATLMYVGPATISLIYLLMSDRGQVFEAGVTSTDKGEEVAHSDDHRFDEVA